MYLGIEIGGTKLQLGIGPGDGTLAGLSRGTVDVAAGPEGIRRQITAAVPELLSKSGLSPRDLKGVGIGFGGPVDDATRTVIKSHQIEGWDNFPLADWVGELVGLPAVLGNDADCAGLAEALFGAGKGLSPIFYITIGSGIGGGLIINGEIYRGCGRGAAEIGHIPVQPKFWFFPPDGVTSYGAERSLAELGREVAQGPFPIPLEEIASGWGLARIAQDTLAAGFIGPDSKLLRLVNGQPERITAELVMAAAFNDEDGHDDPDTTCWYLFDQACSALADGISAVITLLAPRRIVIGGGLSLMGEKLLRPLREAVAWKVFRPFAECYDIVPAALGEEVVVHGALALARRKLVDRA
jgi:glucokinase